MAAGRRSRRAALLSDGAKMILDASAVVVAALVAASARFGDPFSSDLRWLSGFGILLLAVGWSASLATAGAYQRKLVGNPSEENRRITRAAIYFGGGLAILLYATNSPISRMFAAVVTVLALVLTLASRYVLQAIIRRTYKSGRATSGVVLVGTGESVPDMAERLTSATDHGFRVVGACLPADDVDLELQNRLKVLGVPVIGTPDNLADVVSAFNAQAVIITAPTEFGSARVRQMSWDIESTDAEFMVSTGLEQVAGHRVRVRQAGRAGLLQIDQPMYAGAKRVVKTASDRIVAGLALVFLVPLFALVTALVRLDSKGKAFYVQTRVGKGGKTFRMVKFRSMYADETELKRAQEQLAAQKAEIAAQTAGLAGDEPDRGPMFKDRADPRITKVGRFLRKSSLDELPQLLNVLTGSMSLVGPRPALPSEVAAYGDPAKRRLLVKPGLTGLWQVSGRSDLSWSETVRLDLHYVENWTAGLDLSIVARTFKAVFRSVGAY